MLRIQFRLLPGRNIQPGPFNLGKLSIPIAVTAVTFMSFIIIVFMFPSSPDPASATMNYTVVVLGGTLTLAVLYFYFPKYGGAVWFKGPVTTVDSESEGTKTQDASFSEKDI